VTQPVLFSEVILASLNELLFLLWIETLTSYATLQAVEPPAEKKRTSQIFTKGFCKFYTIYTSSTAQGGGGSFKNRKPIGEIGCCESGMAERIH